MSDEGAPGRRCRHCDYELTGLREPRCPECGRVIDDTPRRRWPWRTALALLGVTYAPYAWLVWTDEPWSPYRWQWIASWPVLPGLLPSHFILRRYSIAIEYAGAGVATAILLAILLWIATRGRRQLVAILVITLLLSILNSCGTYHAFRM